MKINKLQTFRSSVFCALLTAVFAFLPGNSAQAQDWRFEPIFKVGGEYDDNSTLDPRTDQEVDISGILLDARADINYSSPTSTFFVQPRVLSRNYDDDSDLDSDDFFVRSNFRRQAQLSTFGFRLNFDNQSVRTGERADTDLEIEDPDEIANDETGRLLRTGDRTKWRVFPYWDYRLSNVSTIGAEFDYFDTQYDDVFAGILTDYSDARLNLRYRRSLSNVTKWGLLLTARRYDADNSPSELDGYGLSAELEHRLSEKTLVRALIGLEDTDQDGADSDPEVVGSVTITRNLEIIRLFARYQRSISGGGAGGLTTRDSINVNFRRRLNERISAGLGVRAYRTDVPSAFEIQDRDYVQLQSNFLWYVSKSFVIEADYRYTVLDRGDAFGGASNSNRFNLWFVYQPRTVPKI